MPTNPEINRHLTSMTLLGYDRKTRVYKYRDDRDGSVWQTHPKKIYGELKPYCHQPLHDTEHRPPWDEKNPKRTWTNLYLVDPDHEVYVPDGTRGKKARMLGVVWEHDYDEGWDVFVDHWPDHLVRRTRISGEPEPDAEKRGGTL